MTEQEILAPIAELMDGASLVGSRAVARHLACIQQNSMGVNRVTDYISTWEKELDCHDWDVLVTNPGMTSRVFIAALEMAFLVVSNKGVTVRGGGQEGRYENPAIRRVFKVSDNETGKHIMDVICVTEIARWKDNIPLHIIKDSIIPLTVQAVCSIRENQGHLTFPKLSALNSSGLKYRMSRDSRVSLSGDMAKWSDRLNTITTARVTC